MAATVTTDSIFIGDQVTLRFEAGNLCGLIGCETSYNPKCLVKEMPAKDPYLPNFEMYSFQVLVERKYRSMHEFRRKLKEANIEWADRDLVTDPDLTRLKRLMEAEEEDNAVEQKRMTGKQLYYGQIIELRNMFSELFVKVSSKETAITDNSSMRVVYDEVSSKDTTFRILPRFRVRSEGDVVRAGDQVVFESCSRSGNYLHCNSNERFGAEFIEKDSFEIDLSVQRSAFGIYPYGLNPSLRTPGLVESGDYIRLFHTETDCYLTSEGQLDGEPLEDVHLRHRPDMKKGSRTPFPTASIHVWQIETVDSLQGGPFPWGGLCRFKHLITRRYLAIKEGRVELTLNHRDPDCVFTLKAEFENGIYVTYGTYIHIQHTKSKLWLHALGGAYSRKQYAGMDLKTPTIKNMTWDRASLHQIGGHEKRLDNDAFQMTSVDEDQVEAFNFLAGTLPSLRLFLQKHKNGQKVSKKEATGLKYVLKTVEKYLFLHGDPVKVHQKLLRHLGFIDLMVEILTAVRSQVTRGRDTKTEAGTVSRAIYSLLKSYLSGKSLKNALYIARHVDLFQEQVEFGVGSTDMLQEFFRDNSRILNQITESRIDKFIDLLSREKVPQYLDFLSILCLCKGEAITKNQNYITRRLLIERKKERLVFLTDCENGPRGDRIVLVTQEEGLPRVDLVDFVKVKPDDDEVRLRRIEYLKRQLALFGVLCEGRNEASIKALTGEELGYLSWEEVSLCAANPKLPYDLRAIYTQLIISLFVDVDRNIKALERVTMIYDYSKLTDQIDESQNDDTLASTGERMAYFPELMRWMHSVLEANPSQVAEDVDKNNFLYTVLKCARYCLMYGYYSGVDNLKALLAPVISMLNGKNDSPVPDCPDNSRLEWVKYDRYKRNKKNNALIQAKTQGLKILELTMNYCTEQRIYQFMFAFKSRKGNFALARLGRLELDGRVQNVGSLQEDLATLERIFEKTDYYDPTGDLVDVLLDLSQYHQRDVIAMSMRLINRYFNAHQEVIDGIVQTQVLLQQDSLDLFAQYDKEFPRFRAALDSDLDEKNISYLKSFFEKFMRACLLDPNSVDNGLMENHRSNQWVVYNSGILDDIMYLLDKEVDLNSKIGGMYKDLLASTFKFLRILCLGFPEVQSSVNEQLHNVLDVKGAEAEMALVVMEVFNANKDLCMSVKEDYIRRCVELLASTSRPEFFEALNAIIKLEEINLPLKRNQALIMKYLSLHRDAVLKLIDPSDRGNRLALLETAPDNSLELTYFLRMVEVLATCAEGENRFIESLCQNMFSLKEDIFAITNHPRIPADRKFPFIRFMIWVYLNTSAGPVESGVANIFKKDYMWATISFVSMYLRQLIVGADKLSSTDLRKRFNSNVMPHLFEAVFPLISVFYRDFYAEDMQSDEQKKISVELARFVLEFLSLADRIVKDEIQFGLVKEAAMTLATSVSSLSEGERLRVFNILESHSRSRRVVATEARRRYDKEYADQDEINDILNTWVVNVGKEYGKMDGYAENEEDQEGDRFDSDLPRGKEFLDQMSLFVQFHGRGNVAISRGKVMPIDQIKAYVEKLVTQLTVSQKNVNTLSYVEKRDEDELNLKSIKILRNMIRHQNRRLDGLIRSDDPAYYDSVVASVSMVQEQLNDYGATLAAIRLLSYPSDNVVKESLKLLIELLGGDNAKVQKTIQVHFETTTEDIFFQVGKTRLENTLAALKERKVLKAQIEKHRIQKAQLEETLKLSTTQGNPEMHAAIHSDVEPELGETSDFLKDVDLSFKDGYGSKLVLRAIENLCGGEQRFLQNYIRVQPDNVTSVNLVSTCLKFLQGVYSNIDSETSLLAIEVVTTLTESIIGNPENQAILLDEKLMDPVNFILRSIKFPGVRSRVVARLKLEVANLVLAIVEYNNDRTTSFAKEIIATLDLKAVHENMNYYYFLNEEMKKSKLSKSKRFDAEKVGLTFYLLLRRLSDFSPKEFRHEYVFGAQAQDPDAVEKYVPPKVRNPLDMVINFAKKIWERKPKVDPEEKKRQKKIKLDERVLSDESNSKYDYFRRKVESVEITRGEEIHRVHFPVKSKDALRDSVKEHLKYDIDRFHGPAEKIRDFVVRSRCIISDMARMEKLMKNKYLRPIIQFGYLWRRFMMLFTILLNIIMCVAYDASPSIFEYEPIKPDWFNPVFYTFGAFHLIFTILVVFEYFLTGTQKATPEDMLKKKVDESRLDRALDFVHRWTPSGATIYHVLLFVMSILGLYYHGYCYSFHLLYFAKDNPILDNVFVAITSSGLSLLWVAIFTLIVIYIYALLAFALYRHSFDSRQGLRCEVLGDCFITVMSFGLRGDLADTIPAFTYGWTELAWRTIYDLSFWVLVTVVGLNLVFTVIVGTFARLREERAIIAQDLRDTCIICSLSSYDFERFAKGFYHHTTFEHNIFDYIWFMIHLRQKDPTMYTSHENYVADLLDDDNFDFFPMNQSLSLQQGGDVGFEKKIANIENKVGALVRKYKRMELERIRQIEMENTNNVKQQLLG